MKKRLAMAGRFFSMGLFLAALAAQGILSSTEITAKRSHTTMIPVVELEQVDVREALRKLFRESRFGGTIAPDVQGTVTVYLRNVNFDTALQNILRQVDATFRIDHGFFEVVKRADSIDFLPYDFPHEASVAEVDIEATYYQMATEVMLGKGKDLVSHLAPDFEARNATETKRADRAIRSLIDTQRAYPRFSIGPEPIQSKGGLEFLITFSRANSTIYFRDSWREVSKGKWLLYAREETALQPSHRFVNVPLSRILKEVLKGMGASYTFDPSLDHNVTIDLTGLPLGTALSRLLSPINATYRIEGGVYEISNRR